jgi:hypothetical protein
MVEAGGIGKGRWARGNSWGGYGRRHGGLWWPQRETGRPAAAPLPPAAVAHRAATPSPALGLTPLRHMVETGGIGEGGRATDGDDMDGAMADCGGRGTGGGVAAEAVAAAEI